MAWHDTNAHAARVEQPACQNRHGAARHDTPAQSAESPNNWISADGCLPQTQRMHTTQRNNAAHTPPPRIATSSHQRTCGKLKLSLCEAKRSPIKRLPVKAKLCNLRRSTARPSTHPPIPRITSELRASNERATSGLRANHRWTKRAPRATPRAMGLAVYCASLPTRAARACVPSRAPPTWLPRAVRCLGTRRASLANLHLRDGVAQGFGGAEAAAQPRRRCARALHKVQGKTNVARLQKKG